MTVGVQGINNTGHVLTDGSTIPLGKSRSAAVYVEADYAVTDRLWISAAIPFVFAKYLGPPPPAGMPEPPMVQPDDACYCWQSGIQDLTATVRYNLLSGSTAITPSITFGVPTWDYPYRGEAVVGRNLRELRFGVDAGRRIESISPRLFLAGRYSYALVEEVLQVPNDRSNISVELTFGLTDRLSLSANVARQITHGGLRAGTGPPGPDGGVPWGEITTPELFREHDRLLRDNYWRAGGVVSYGFSRANVFISYVEFLGGTDTHAGRSMTTGVSVPFHIDRP